MTTDLLAADAACRTTHVAALVAAEAIGPERLDEVLRTDDLAAYTAAYVAYTDACAAYAKASDAAYAAYAAKRNALAQEAR